MRRRSNPLVMLVGLVVVLGLLGVACGKSSTTSPTEAASAPAGGGTTLQQGTGNALVFSPTKLTVSQGETITVQNVGSFPHTFTISSQGIDVVNNPGQSQQVTINLAPGTYEFICRFHVSSGMKGTLIVT